MASAMKEWLWKIYRDGVESDIVYLPLATEVKLKIKMKLITSQVLLDIDSFCYANYLACRMVKCYILTILLHGCSILVEQTSTGLLVAHSILLAMIMMLQLMNMVGETRSK